MRWSILLLVLFAVPSVSAASVLVPEWANQPVQLAGTRQLVFTIRGGQDGVNGTFYVKTSGPIGFSTGNFSFRVDLAPNETGTIEMTAKANGNSTTLVPVDYGLRYGSGMFEQVLNSQFMFNISSYVAGNVSGNANVTNNTGGGTSSSQSPKKTAKAASSPVVSSPPKNNSSGPANTSLMPASPKKGPEEVAVQDIAGQEGGVNQISIPPSSSSEKTVQAVKVGEKVKSPPFVLLLFILVILISIVLQVATIHYVRNMEG